MSVTSPIPVLLALMLAWGVSWVLMKSFGPPPKAGRYLSIDGLRGYLALGVFLHHGCIWFIYLQGQGWGKNLTPLYSHLGQSAVSLFFMITAFLFFSKLIDSRDEGVDWSRLYISRVLRLTPLYLFMLALVGLMVVYRSNGQLREDPVTVLVEVAHWVAFTLFTAPDINGVKDSFTMTAYVTWSLVLEWFFYLSLPLQALLVGLRPSWLLLVCGVIGAACMLAWKPGGAWLMSFAAGVWTAVLVRQDIFRKWSQTYWASAVIIACIVAVVNLFPTVFNLRPVFLLFIAFALMAGGNSLFGFLTHPVSRTLGEMAYSIYLLHGFVLYVTMTLVFDARQSLSWSPLMHWTAVIGALPLLLVFCFATFKLVELPAMNRVTSMTHWWQVRVRGRGQRP